MPGDDPEASRLLGAIDERSKRTLEAVLRIEDTLSGHTVDIADHERRIADLEQERKDREQVKDEAASGRRLYRRDWIGWGLQIAVTISGWAVYLFHSLTTSPPPK